MRLIYGFLALANLRWANAELARAARLMRDADEAHATAQVRLTRSGAFLNRAQCLRS